MWEVIKWFFKEHWKINHLTEDELDWIVEWNHWSSVSSIDKYNWYSDIEICREEMQNTIVRIIDEIIDSWIQEYKKTNNHIWNFQSDTTDIWQEMYLKAQAIEDTFDYISNDDETDIWWFSDTYIYDSIAFLLYDYREKVVLLLRKKYKEEKK